MALKMEIKLIKSTFYKEQKTKKNLANFILNSSFLSMGKSCKKFEEEFSKYQRRKYSVLVSSGSAANLLLIQALRNKKLLKRKDYVGVSALTWATNVMPLIQLGLKPIPVDCELETINISKKLFEKRLQEIPGIKCLFLTNALGFASDIQEISRFCKEKRIILLEDNCESLGSEIDGKKLGNFGLASTFSFFVGHHLSTIEGGMICTDDKDLYDALIMARAHGWDRNLDKESQDKMRENHRISDFFNKYTFYDLAYNLRPTEITGFLGLEQLKYIEEIVKIRHDNFEKFNKAIDNNPEVIRLKVSHLNKVSNFNFPLIFKNKDASERWKKRFVEAGVEIRPIIAGNIQEQPFYKKYIPVKFPCKNTDLIHANGFYFGNNPELTPKEINILTGLIKSPAKEAE